jgi:hypothetical protein
VRLLPLDANGDDDDGGGQHIARHAHDTQRKQRNGTRTRISLCPTTRGPGRDW